MIDWSEYDHDTGTMSGESYPYNFYITKDKDLGGYSWEMYEYDYATGNDEKIGSGETLTLDEAQRECELELQKETLIP